MSILLEALRKSENSQRTREAPTIHSAVPSAPPGRLGNPLIIGVLLLLTLAICTWFVWQQYKAPAGDEPETGIAAVQPAREEAGKPVQLPEKPPARPRAGNASPNSSQAVSVEGSQQQAASEKVISANQASGPRTPVESYQPPAESRVEDAVSSSPAVAARNVKPFASKDRESRQASSRRESSENLTTVSVKEEEPVRPQEPEMLGYWDLPDNVRAGIPEFTFTVLVYDKKPENRFVLINGERFVEGDTQQPGLVVEEIRREGVVFSYRLYRFLVEK